jgi:hypothetical protein
MDHNGREQLVTIQRSSTHPGKDAIFYSWHRAGAKGPWSKQRVPILVSAAGLPEAQMSLIGAHRIGVVIQACNGTFAAIVTSSTRRLPKLTTVTSYNFCSLYAQHGTEDQFFVPTQVSAPFQDLADGGREELAIAAYDPDATGVFAMRSDGSVSTIDGPDFGLEELIPDGSGLTAIGYGIYNFDEDNPKAVVASRMTWVYDQTTNTHVAQWSTPADIADLGNASRFLIDSATSYHGTIDVGLYDDPRNDSGYTHTLFTLERDPQGQWSALKPIPHSGSSDNYLIVVRNQATGGLHAAFLHSIASPPSARTAKSGIIKIRQNPSGTKWLPRTFATHWYKDLPLMASVNSDGRMYIEYQHR